MSPRSRSLVLLCITLVVGVLLVYAVSARLAMVGLRDMEEAEARRNVERAAVAVRNVLDRLAGRAKAWACLDETRRFIEDRNQAYIDSNLLSHGLFTDIELNAVVYRHVTGRIVYAEGWPPDARRGTAMPESLLSLLTPDSPLLRSEDDRIGASGLLLLPEGPLLAAGHPIVPGDTGEPSRGTLLLGRFLDGRLVQELAAATMLELHVRRPVEGASQAGTAGCPAPGGEDFQVRRIDGGTWVGSVCLRDVHGRPAITLEVETPRDLYRHGEAGLTQGAVWAVAVGAGWGAGAFWLLGRLASSRRVGGRMRHEEQAKTSRENLQRLVEERSQSLLDAERQLLQQEKLASVGQLAAGIAHEINTPIQYIGDNLQALSSAFQDLLVVESRYRELVQMVKAGTVTPEAVQGVEDAEREHDVDYIIEDTPKAISQSLDGVRRVSHIVRAMKDFSHIDRGEVSAVDINHALESTLTIARNEYKYVADVETDFGELPPVDCYAGELNQVFLNILVNAAHAIGDTGQRGKITVRTRPLDESVEVSIADTGTGIPEEIRHKVYEPFFTTKEVGKGTGQGLSIAHQIVVQKHGGSLAFESQVGVGTTFIIRVPTRMTAAAKVQGDQK
ncbi:MAG TPA: CHASE4 domain-containing protein [Phycisphaerae bacterium]|nr:CHASE4 domain-containing protein [Phycisphaerae bacterium]HRY70408.1 CHASE4 domain-containing protein [Phycisphaerae bacterium]